MIGKPHGSTKLWNLRSTILFTKRATLQVKMRSSYIIRKYIKYIPLQWIFFEQEEERESWLFVPPNMLVQRKFIDPTSPFLYVSPCTYFYLATIWNKFATHKTEEPKTVSSKTQEMTNYVACVFLFPSFEYQMSLETGKKKNRAK